MTMTNFHQIGKDEITRARKLLGEDFPQIGSHYLILSSANGDSVYDIYGKRYIDCTSQNWVAAIGHNHPKVISSVKKCIDDGLVHAITRVDTIPKLKLANRIIDLSPGNMTSVSFCLGGSLAVEGAMKLCLHNRTDSRFAVLEGSYHGRTLATIMLSFLRKLKPEFNSIFKDGPIELPRAYCYRCKYDKKYPNCSFECIIDTDKILSSTRPIGLVYEPIQGDGGQLSFPPEYHVKLAGLCKKYDIPLIVDEIQTGFGKLKTIFASDMYNIKPDIIAFGKAAGGGLPFFGTVSGDKFKWQERDHTFTFSHFPLGIVAALTTLDIIEDEKVCEQADEKGRWLIKELRLLQSTHKDIGDVRGEGMLIGVELVKNGKEANKEGCSKLIDYGIDNGVLFGCDFYQGNVLKIKPPSIIGYDSMSKVLDVIDSGLRKL